MYKMFLDDLRIASKYYEDDPNMVTIRSYYDAVKYVQEHGIPSFVSFDHDLGDENEVEKTGYDFAKFLIEYMLDNNINEPFAYYVHSANPVGAENIRMYLNQSFEVICKDL